MTNVVQFQPKEKTRQVRIRQCDCSSEEFHITEDNRILCSNCCKLIQDFIVIQLRDYYENK